MEHIGNPTQAETVAYFERILKEKDSQIAQVKKMLTTYSNNGEALTVELAGCVAPAKYTFACVNDFVHASETNFEELQYLALGMASHVEKLTHVLDDLCANAETVCDCLEMGQTLKSPDTLRNFRKSLNDGWAAIPLIDAAA